MLLRIALVVATLPGVAIADKTFAKGTGETYDCTTDPVVTIKTNKGTYGFLGECKKITIKGRTNAVSTASVGKLVVYGSDNLIDIEQVDTINAGGLKNTITWKRAGTGDKPKITPGSKTNKIAKKS